MHKGGDCFECGARLSADAPAGLCPHCLLKVALDSAALAAEPFDLPDGPSFAGTTVHYFGDYELLEELGRGGMGVVYKARQVSLNRIVAVKMMRPGLLSSEADVQRFHVEAEAAASLQHPCIVAIHEVGEHDGLCYFSMDYVEGQNLADIVHHEPLSAKRAAAYVKTIAEAVHHAHQHGLLHRDLKPANVIIDPTDRPRITDFGLARRIESDSRLTETGAVLGTPSYMPPEQAAGRNQELGPVSDVYSLGAILYELLCGRPPFQAESPIDTLLLVLRTEPVAPRLLNPSIPRDLETICLKCLEKDGRRRYASAQELADDLGRFLANEPIRARRIGLAGRGLRWCRRNPWQAIAAAGLVLVALLATFSAINWRDRVWRSMVDQARSERLAGNRARSLELLAEAARMKESDDLKQEAIQTIVTSGVRLRQSIPFPGPDRIVPSADSKLIAIAGKKSVSHERTTASGYATEYEHIPTIEVWEVETGRRLSVIKRDQEGLSDVDLAFSPTEPLLAETRDHHFTKTRGATTVSEGIHTRSVVFWNPLNGERIGDVQCRGETCPDNNGDLLFSPDGRRAVRGGSEFGSWLIDVTERRSMTADTEGATVLGFASNNELLLNYEETLRKYNLNTGDEVCVSPEGSSILSVTPDSRVALLGTKDSLLAWDVVAKRQIAVLKRAGEGDSLELMSENGRIVAIVDKSEPHTIRLYDTTLPVMQEKTIALGSNIKLILQFNQVSLSPDGSLLAAFGAVGKMGHILVWDTRTGEQVAMMRDNHSPIWSQNGRLLITRGPRMQSLEDDQKGRSSMNFGDGIGAENSAVNVWDVFGAPPVHLLPDRIGSLAFSPNERQLLSNGVAWDVVSTRARLELHTAGQRLPRDSIALTAGDQLWAVHVDDQIRAAHDGKVLPTRLWKIAPDFREIVLEAPDYSELRSNLTGQLFAQAVGFAISPDGRSLMIASAIWERRSWAGLGSWGYVLDLWDVEKKTRMAIFHEGTFHGFGSMDISPNGRLLAVATRHGGWGISVRDLFSGKEIRHIDNSRYHAALKFSPDGKLLFTAGSSPWEESESPIFVFEVGTGRQVGKWKGHHDGVKSLALSADGTLLASGGNDRLICLWDIQTGRKLAAWEAHQGEVSALAITRDAGTLVSGGSDGALKLWDLSFIRKELSSLGLGW
jgi:eukaryotic-like serine/threonine-protein kinase